MRRLALLFAACLAARAAGPLVIVNTAIEQTDGGTPLPQSFEHIPGEVLFFSFQVQGYKPSPDNKIKLTCKLDAFDPQGVRIIPTVQRPVEAELAPQDKEWKPKVRQDIAIPPLGPSGTYKVVVEVTEELAQTSATRDVPFLVRGHDVAPSDALVIRNLRYYRTEDATEALEKAAYRPGDSVWARFDITGFKYGPGNKIDVSYGIAVLNGDGKQLWAQPDAAVERAESFYPRRYVPGSMSINLQPNIRPGSYALVIIAKDGVGNQTCESKAPFTVE
jgi:hypothetical protein